MKGSDWIRLVPHLLQSRTDLRVPSKTDLIASGRNDQCESSCAATMKARVVCAYLAANQSTRVQLSLRGVGC